jgi:hypothetical protein
LVPQDPSLPFSNLLDGKADGLILQKPTKNAAQRVQCFRLKYKTVYVTAKIDWRKGRQGLTKGLGNVT